MCDFQHTLKTMNFLQINNCLYAQKLERNEMAYVTEYKMVDIALCTAYLIGVNFLIGKNNRIDRDQIELNN